MPGRAARPGARAPAWGGRLFLDAGWILFVGPGGAAERHAHHAVQLVWALEGEFTVTFDAPLRRRAALFPADVPHAFDATGCRVAILFVEPHGAHGAALDRRARAAIGAEAVADLAVVPLPQLDLGWVDAARWCEAAVAALGADERTSPLSSVSRRVIEYVEGAIDGKPQLAEAARRVGLSPTRLTHVFSEEVGIPFRRFVLWTRIKRAVAATQAGDDLTQSAVAAGFSDSAHLSRTFRAMFGLSPSLVLPLAELVESA
ncbi:MAG: helix-turn-helix transcriptional regulator [Kofleriaceae bacterium]|nr:helix-turn-helix transcriptional regulator [Kofleriaceae bacterium]